MLCSFRLSQPLFLGIVFASVLHAQTPSLHRSYAANDPRTDSGLARASDETTTVELDKIRSQLQASPNDPVLLNNLAVLYVKEDRLADALETSRRSVAINGNLAATRVNLASIYEQLGMAAKARTEAAAAAELQPKDIDIRSYVCDLDLVYDRNREAAECYRVLLRDFPPRPELRLRFGTSLFKSGQIAEAKTVLETSHVEAPDDPMVLNILGNVYYRLEEYDKAAALLKQAVERNPEDPVLRFNLGVAYLASKNRPGALSQYNLIKESNPELAGKLYRTLFQKYIVNVRR